MTRQGLVMTLLCLLLQLYDNDIITRQGLVMTLLQEHGQAMTTGVISASVSALPPSMISDAAEILHELLVTDKTVRPTLAL